MGQVIRKNAAVGDIFADVRSAVINAAAKGGTWKTLADAQLGSIVTLIDTTEAQLDAAEKELEPLHAAVEARDDEADHLLGRVSDVIWNEVGRPASDPALSTLFPGGVSYYTSGSTDEQPGRMELLAALLERGTHPKLSSATATALAKEVRDSAALLRAAVDAQRAPAERHRQLEQVQKALARTAQSELQNLKRHYKAENFSEADIHTVIPDRPRRTPHPVAPAPAPAPPANSTT